MAEDYRIVVTTYSCGTRIFSIKDLSGTGGVAVDPAREVDAYPVGDTLGELMEDYEKIGRAFRRAPVEVSVDHTFLRERVPA